MTQTHAPSIQTDPRWGADLRSPLVLGLLGLLAVQLLIGLGLGLSDPGTAAAPRTSLIALAPDEVTGIAIEGSAPGDQVRLERRGEDQWVIADLDDFPAASHKVDQLLRSVAELKRPLPVATSEEARKRFKVADTGFTRRLTLEGRQGQIGTLILGDTPSFRRLFGRPDGDPAVYDLPLALSDVSNRREDWLDTGLLRLDREQITGISSEDWTLSKTAEGWRLADRDEPLDQAKVERLVSTLANLTYRDVLGVSEDPAQYLAEPKLAFVITLADGGSRDYRLAPIPESEDHVLKSGDRPYYFRLSKYDLVDLLDLDPSKLTVESQPEAAKTDPSPEPMPEESDPPTAVQ